MRGAKGDYVLSTWRGPMTGVYALVVLLSTAAWFVPMATALSGQMRPRPFQFPVALLFILCLMVGGLLAVGFEYAVGFLMLGGCFGAALTWALLLDT